jgi:D-alanyl-D-alanine carboxypeptidase/D-alanyl-D-alanine-endopeptidase (penicillin-binding protein 4)
MYVSALKDALVRAGIAVAGDAVDADDLHGYVPGAGSELLRDESPPLSEVIDVCLKWSRNDYAETLLRAIAPTQPATAAAAVKLLRQQLATWGIGAPFVVPLDGSGLSRQDYVTAHGLNLLLTYVWRDPALADTFRSALPVAGASGTLAERMKGTPLAGHVWAKTGTLNNVRSLAGYLETASGEPVVFSMLSNNFQTPASDIDDAMEKALLRVFEHGRRDIAMNQPRPAAPTPSAATTVH